MKSLLEIVISPFCNDVNLAAAIQIIQAIADISGWLRELGQQLLRQDPFVPTKQECSEHSWPTWYGHGAGPHDPAVVLTGLPGSKRRRVGCAGLDRKCPRRGQHKDAPRVQAAGCCPRAPSLGASGDGQQVAGVDKDLSHQVLRWLQDRQCGRRSRRGASDNSRSEHPNTVGLAIPRASDTMGIDWPCLAVPGRAVDVDGY